MKKRYYNLICPSTDGVPITLDDICLFEMLRDEMRIWENSEFKDEPFEYTINIIEMTEEDFNNLGEFQF